MVPVALTRGKTEQYFMVKKFSMLFKLTQKKPLICGGDFNAVLSSMDIECGVGYHQKKCPSLKDLIEVSHLTDVYRSFHPTNKEFTFFRPGCAPSRLDRFYCSPCLINDIMKIEHIASLSDHCAVNMKINVNVKAMLVQNDIRSSYWKLNVAILNDEDFLPSFKAFWARVLSTCQHFNDIADWRDEVGKPEIKDFCVSFSMRRKEI